MKELCFDISTWQGGINYAEVKKRVNYCILRAGFSTTKDSQFENHYKNLQGLNLGAYWYSYAKNESEAKAEAKAMLNVIKGKKFTLPIYLDIEDPSISKIGKEKLNSIVKAFGKVIEDAGYYFGVYTNMNWYKNVISGSELNKSYDWWIALWGSKEPSGVNYGVWQYTSSYNTFGIRLDANYIVKDYPSIIKNAGLNHLGGNTPSTNPLDKYTDEELANKVINGEYGNGEDRKKALGDRYDKVQAIVNDKLNNSKEEYYVIQKGDNLTKIAKKYGTTVNQLVAWNNISNPNLIYPGQKIRVK